MNVLIWLVSGFVFSCAMVLLIAWTERKSEIKISWFLIAMLLLGSAGGGFTALFITFFGIMLALEDKRVQAWFSKPLKTFKINNKE